jgi:hypothetical protein
VKTKKYALPIVVFHPYFLAGIAVTYLANGRFDLTKNAQVVNVLGQEQVLVSGKIIVPDHTFVAEEQQVLVQAVPEDLDFR